MPYHWPNIPRRLREYMPVVLPEDMTTSVLEGAVARLKYADNLAKYNEEGDRVAIRKAINETYRQFQYALERRKTDEAKYKEAEPFPLPVELTPSEYKLFGVTDGDGDIYMRKLDELRAKYYLPPLESGATFKWEVSDPVFGPRKDPISDEARARHLTAALGTTAHKDIEELTKMPRDSRLTPAPKGKLTTTGLGREVGNRIVSFRLSNEPGATVIHEEVWELGLETYRHGVTCDCHTYVDRSVKMPPSRMGPQATCPHTRAHVECGGDNGFMARFASSRPGWLDPNGTFPPQRFVVNLEWEKPGSRKLARADVEMHFQLDNEDHTKLGRFAFLALSPGYGGTSFGGDHNDGAGFDNYFTHNLLVDWVRVGRKQLMLHVEERLIMLGLEPCPGCLNYGFNDVDAFDPDDELHRFAAIHRGCQYLHREVCRGCAELCDMVPDVDA